MWEIQRYGCLDSFSASGQPWWETGQTFEGCAVDLLSLSREGLEVAWYVRMIWIIQCGCPDSTELCIRFILTWWRPWHLKPSCRALSLFDRTQTRKVELKLLKLKLRNSFVMKIVKRYLQKGETAELSDSTTDTAVWIGKPLRRALLTILKWGFKFSQVYDCNKALLIVLFSSLDIPNLSHECRSGNSTKPRWGCGLPSRENNMEQLVYKSYLFVI